MLSKKQNRGHSEELGNEVPNFFEEEFVGFAESYDKRLFNWREKCSE